ncbi:MAG: stage 0 sporulation family protein [Acidobacteriota bacterium]
MLDVVTVRFEPSKSRSEFLSSHMGLRVGDWCVVTTERGVELGRVLNQRRVENLNFTDAKIHKVLRQATERDLYLYEKKKDREVLAHRLCRKRLKARNLPMKLSKVEYIFDGSRVIFYFTANKRVDFRGLVKDLARELRTRIEMRQIGARDEAKLVGGVGCCGTGENCSAKFLKELRSVTVQTVKAQDLGMNPNRLSGMCGRLKCCLNFEMDRAAR